MPYYAAERLDTGINPLPVGVAYHNQRYTIAPTGSPLYRRGFLSAEQSGVGGCGCGLGADEPKTEEAGGVLGMLTSDLARASFALGAAYLASTKNRSVVGWLVGGALLGPLALVVAFLPPKR